MSKAEIAVSVAGIRKQFAGRTILDDLSFGAASGEILGLVGENGGGKTTTLRVLAGVLAPDAGAGTILGRPLADPTNRRNIGYMTQSNALYPELTVSENLNFRAAVHGVGRVQLAEAVETYAIGDVMNQSVASLSGGWARRVAFVATVLHKPKLLLLDEPTAGLDVVTRREMWRWLGNLASAGSSIIVSSHDLIEAAQCAHIMIYRGGKVLGPTTLEAVLARWNSATLEDAMFTMAAP